MKRYNINDTTLSVWERGQGVPVLFVHGFPFDHSIWNRAFDALTHCTSGETGGQSLGKDLRLISPDLRGLGESPLPEEVGPTGMEQFADDLHALLDAMDIREKVVVCGLSMGGYIVMQYARKYGETLAGIVLCSTKTTADPPEVAENRRIQAENLINKPRFLNVVAETMIPKLFSEKTRNEKPEVVLELRSIIEKNNPRGAAAATLGMAGRPDTTELLGKLDVPVLVVCGGEDTFSPPAEMQPLSEIAKTGKYVEISDAGHLPPMEQPEAFVSALTDFVGSL